MEEKNINTEGKFKYRIKPDINHTDQYLNRAVEELQKDVLILRDIIEELSECVHSLINKLDKKE